MKIVLANSPLIDNKITRDMAGGLGFDATEQTLLPPLELAILAASLQKEKHQVKIIDPEPQNLSPKQVIQNIANWNPHFVITTISLPSLDNDLGFINRLRQQLKGKIFAKTSITFQPILEKILKSSQTDLCLTGEVDLEINKIINRKSKRGTTFLKNNQLITYNSPPVENLDLLPLPARGLLNNKIYRYPLLGSNCTIIQTSRGCPFSCAYYCPYPLVQGKKWRPMSPKRVIKELIDITRKHKIKKVLFRDAVFTLDQNRASKICQQIIKNKLKFSWWCETRVNCLNKKLLAIMKQAGCQGINLGVETGDPLVMKTQAKPGVDLAQLKNISQTADKIGIKLHFLLLIGLPQESRQSLYQTFKLIKKLKPFSLGATVITPYPGTKLFHDALEKNWIETQDWSHYSGNLITMHTDNFHSWEMKLAQKMIQAEMLLLSKGFLGKIGLAIEDLIFKIWSKL